MKKFYDGDGAGDEVHLGVDANNGYDLDIAKRFLEQTSDFRLDFIEEPFLNRSSPAWN